MQMRYFDDTTVSMPFEFEGLVSTRPDQWQGLPISWIKSAMPHPVFIGEFSYDAGDLANRVFLCAVRYSLPEAMLNGEAAGKGFFLEFFVISQVKESWQVTRLTQRESVTYSDLDESKDYVAARLVKKPAELSAAAIPKWKVSEAIWPTLREQPMHFLAQVPLPENSTTSSYLTWGISVFLFYLVDVDKVNFKVVQQETAFQTADEY